jgi:O-acetyl-ADP-ribose deacetylase (regulator of RNase III)
MPRIEVVRADITTLDVDIIVNAAAPSLLGGCGVDGAIHRAAGYGLTTEVRQMNGCPTGEVRLTGGHWLKAKYIIHAVGPIWGHDSDAQLRSCYQKALELAEAKQAGSIAFPCISTGAYGYPKGVACPIAFDTVAVWLSDHEYPRRVIFCCFDPPDVLLYTARLVEFEATA